MTSALNVDVADLLEGVSRKELEARAAKLSAAYRAGGTSAAVGILSNLGVKFKAIDVLKDPEIRQGIKEFSNWPTIPQLYVKGEFVGGCDILKEMYEADELAPFLAEKGIVLENA